jgi:ubiquitin-conjugating enzyme E2 S
MSGSAENLPPQVVSKVVKELRKLSRSPPDGIKYIPTEKIGEVHAEIEGPSETPYEGGVFRIKLVLGSDFPTAPPRGYFLTKIFHPNIANNGDICVNTLKRDWKPDLGLSHVLQVIRCLLIVPFPESSLNDNAGKMFLESYDDYAKRAKLMTSIHASRKTSSTSSGKSSVKIATKKIDAAAKSTDSGGRRCVSPLGASNRSSEEVAAKPARKIKTADAATKIKKQKSKKKKSLRRL